MPTTNKSDYGIKYSKVKINETTYILIPEDLVEGYSMGNTFYSTEIYTTIEEVADIEKSDTFIDSIYSTDELISLYEYEDLDFLKEYFLNEEKDSILVVTIEKGKIIKKKISKELLTQNNPTETYERQKGKPSVTLNNDALAILLNATDLEDVRKELLRYKNLIATFRDKEKKNGTTKVVVENGHVKEIVTDHKVSTKKGIAKSSKTSETGAEIVTGVSIKGLESYIKERVFGHDQEIEDIATSILMNFTAEKGEKVEPILLVGPTGTGKTETMKAAMSYLDIPLIEVNTPNLVPQGIKGMSLEDCLYSLIVSTNYDLEKAQRGLVFMDEFDKLGEISSDYKSSIVQILLKFIEGDTFMIDKPTDDYNFDTSMLIKVFAGAFSNLFETRKSIGFNSDKATTEFSPRSITEKEYFGKELVTRIPHIYVYHELDRLTQKRVLTESKLSELLQKRKRYQRQFGVETTVEDSYIEAVLNRLKIEEKSMRELNNIILGSLKSIERELLSEPGKYKRLVLTGDTVENPKQFKLY